MANKIDLEEIRLLPNIAEKLDESVLKDIGKRVLEGFEVDLQSQEEWLEVANEAIKMAKLEHEQKNQPWIGASNIKYPVITTAQQQFVARSYSEFVANGRVVQTAVLGKSSPDKESRAKRVSDFMSTQLLIEDPAWSAHTDKMLNSVSLIGTTLKKTYFNPLSGKNESITCKHDEVIINNNVNSLEEAPRISHILYRYHNDIISNQREGLYLEVDLPKTNADNTVDVIHELIEQHCWLDLDEDGYEEPYIVLIDRESSQVLRIVDRFKGEIQRNEKDQVSRIEPIHYFSDFHFLPSADGKFFSMGFGQLLLDMNHAINSITNQLIDAGTLANTQAGLISGDLRLKDGTMAFQPGEWKKVNSVNGESIANNVFPLVYKEPSNVLLQKLQLLLTASKELSSVTEVLMGTEQGQNVPATTMLSLVEQSLKVFSSIQRRLFRGFKKEFEKLYELNRLHLDDTEYSNIMDDENAIKRADFEDKSMDVRPIADPNMSSTAQRNLKLQALFQLAQYGMLNMEELHKMQLEELEEDPERLLRPADQEQPPSDTELKMQMEQQKLESNHALRERDLALREQQNQLAALKAEFEMQEIASKAVKNIADAEAAELGNQIAQYKAQLDAITTEQKQISEELKLMQNQQKLDLEQQKVNDARQAAVNTSAPNTGLDQTPDNPTTV